MNNEVFELFRSIVILFSLCGLIYENYKQAKLISLLKKKVISQRQDYEVMSELYRNDLAIRDAIIKAYSIKRDELLGRLQT